VKRALSTVGDRGPAIPDLAGDFDDVVRPYLAAMRRVAAVVAPTLDRDDVVQEALLRAWQKRATYRADLGPIRPWLLALTADRGRRMRHRAKPAGHLLGSTGASTDHDDNRPLREQVQVLPTRQREAVLLYYYADLPVAEVAAVMHCAEGTVKSTLSDARSRLARALGAADDQR
jgi:RNA polymerase sigma factor (sigma-70 family)